MRVRPTFFFVAFVTACGGGESASGGETTEHPSTGATGATSGSSAPAAPARSTCRVVVEEADGGRVSEYTFDHGVLSEVVATDTVSNRTFTTRYQWDDDPRRVRVEKLAEGQEPRPPFEMRYQGTRADGQIVGEHSEDGALLERVTWFYDDAQRPVRCDHEWLPTPEDRAEGFEARAESDECSYDGQGRPATYELSLAGEAVLLIFYRYEGDADFPSGIVEKRIVPPDTPHRDNTIANVERATEVRVTWPSEATDRETRYEGDCRSVFFPAVCSTNAAP